MKNKTGRILLEERYGKGCFIERAGIRMITKDEEFILKRSIKGFKKLDRTITYHHIKERRNGGKVTIENGANLAAYNHQWFNEQTPQIQSKINSRLQHFKWEIDMGIISIQSNRLKVERAGTKSNDLNDNEEILEIPMYENSIFEDKEFRKRKFNRAQQKVQTQKLIEEEFCDLER